MMAAWWSGLGRGQRVLLAGLAMVLALNVALVGIGSMVGGSPGGPVSSSFGTGGRGLQAYAELLQRDGHRVTRIRFEITTKDLRVGATAVVADPSGLTPAAARRLTRFVAGGGRLVLAGQASAPLLQSLTGSPVRWGSAGRVDRLTVWLPVDGTGRARELAGDHGGRWNEPGALVPAVGANGRTAVLVGPVGAGRVVALADSALLQNSQLAQADNAAFGLAAAGDRNRPVVFVESVHGQSNVGLDAIPSGWKWAALALFLVVVPAGLWAAGSRFGPPEPGQRHLRPPRQDHVEAVAASLDRVSSSAGDPETDSPASDSLGANP